MSAVGRVRIHLQHHRARLSPSPSPAKESGDEGGPLTTTGCALYCSGTPNLADDTSKVSTSRNHVPAGVLREVRARKVTTRELATLLGVRQPSAWRRLSGETAWTVDDLVILSHAWDVSLRDLIE